MGRRRADRTNEIERSGDRTPKEEMRGGRSVGRSTDLNWPISIARTGPFDPRMHRGWVFHLDRDRDESVADPSVARFRRRRRRRCGTPFPSPQQEEQLPMPPLVCALATGKMGDRSTDRSTDRSRRRQIMLVAQGLSQFVLGWSMIGRGSMEAAPPGSDSVVDRTGTRTTHAWHDAAIRLLTIIKSTPAIEIEIDRPHAAHPCV